MGLFDDDDAFDADEARYDRQNRLNPPEFAPGQGDDLFSSGFEQPNSGGGFDAFSSPSSDPFGGGGSDPFGGGGMAGSFGGGGAFGSQPAQNQNKSDEDKFFDAIVKGGKGFANFFGDITGSFKNVTPKFLSLYGKNVSIASACVTGVGLVMCLFKAQGGMSLLLGGILSLATGIMILMFNVEKGTQCSSMYKKNNKRKEVAPPTPQPAFNPAPQPALGGNDSFFGDDMLDEEDEDEDEDAFGDDEDDDSDLFNTQGEPQAGEDVDKAFEELAEVPAGMYTRSYLYEMFAKVLPNLKPDYNKVKKYDEDDDIFLQWEASLREAAEVSGCKEENLPDLLELEEALLTIKVVCTRTTGMKPDLVADELAKIYADSNSKKEDKVYAVAKTVGKKCVITLYTGETALVSLKDMYAKIKDDILNSEKNYMPVVLGIDQSGEVIWCDFKKIESCIVAGMPRSGKTWLVQAILTQMCAFVSPKELNLYIFDPKAGTSDFRSFTLPHVKKFATKYKDTNGNTVNPEGLGVLATLEQIVKVEAPRRKKLLGDAKCVNIWDFRKKCPDVELPLLYVVVDEAVTLAEDMDKEDKAIYKSYITQLITQFPNLGIRAFLIPHVVKDQVLPKTATDSVKCRISVKGSSDHIESSTGTKPRDFKYKLCNTGDMAVFMPDIRQETMFVHGVAISDENEKNAEIFDYLRRVWSKLEPTSVKGSEAVRGEEEREIEKLLNVKQEVLSDDIDDLFSNNEDSKGLTGVLSSQDSFEEDKETGVPDDLFADDGTPDDLFAEGDNSLDQDDFLSDLR